MPKPEFESLLDDLIGLQQEQETMSKALGSDKDDEEIHEAAGEGAAESEAAEIEAGEDGHAEPDGDENGKDKDGDGDGKEMMGKSFMIETDSGEQVEAYDATELVKSLMGKTAATEEFVGKAIAQMTTVIGGQSQMIKSLQTELNALKGAGRGRKAVVTINEPPKEQMNKSMPAGRDDIMTKCMSAFDQGKLSGLDVSRAESYLNNRQPVPADILAKIDL